MCCDLSKLRLMPEKPMQGEEMTIEFQNIKGWKGPKWRKHKEESLPSPKLVRVSIHEKSASLARTLYHLYQFS